jgi:hypothetical protein
MDLDIINQQYFDYITSSDFIKKHEIEQQQAVINYNKQVREYNSIFSNLNRKEKDDLERKISKLNVEIESERKHLYKPINIDLILTKDQKKYYSKFDKIYHAGAKNKDLYLYYISQVFSPKLSEKKRNVESFYLGYSQ